MMTADQILASKTPEQLYAALARGQSMLHAVEISEQSDDDFDGPFPPTKQYERWKLQADATLRATLEQGMHDVRAELARRGLSLNGRGE
jgi:hypothetical protein